MNTCRVVYFVTSRENIADAVNREPISTLALAEENAKYSANICNLEFVIVRGTIQVEKEVVSFFPEKKP